MSKKFLFIVPILVFQVGCTTNPINQAPVYNNNLADQRTHSFPYPKSSVQQAFQRYFTKERSCFQVMDQYSCFDQVPRGVPKTKYNEQLYTIEYLPSSKNQTIVSLRISGENSSSAKLIFDKVTKYLGGNYKKNQTSQSQIEGKVSARNQSPTPNGPKDNDQPSSNNSIVTPLITTQPKVSMDKSTKECMNHARLGNRVEFTKCVEYMSSSYKREGVRLMNDRAKMDFQRQKSASDTLMNSMRTNLKKCMAYKEMGDIEEYEECMAKFKTQLPENPYKKWLEE